MIKNNIILLLTFLYAISLFSQSPHAIQDQYKFKYLTVDQGLSNNNVRSICQDSKGFIWIATQNGTNKFDGQTNIVYKNDPDDSTTISSNAVISIFSDSKNNLWFSSDEGLDLYNENFDNFIRFSHKDIDGPIIGVEEIVEDKDGKIWISYKKGLISYDLNTSDVQLFCTEEGNPYGLPPNQINRLLVDRNNNLWFSILDEGLCLYKQDEGTFKYFKNDPDDPSTISGNRIERLYEDSKGNIWAGTFNDGLNLYVPKSSSFKRIIPDPDNNYSTRVRAIFEDTKGDFFVGTRCGLYMQNMLTNEFYLYASEEHNFSKLSQKSITSSYIDKSGTLWIGTFSGGVNYTRLHRKGFIHYTAGIKDNHYLKGANVYAITEDEKGNLWVGGDNGLNFLDRTTHTFTYYINNPDDPNSLSYNDVKALEWDKNGNLWIGTNNGGLNYYNVKTGKFKSYMHDPADPNSLTRNKIYGLICDNNNNLWIITNSNVDYKLSNVDILPNGTEKFTHLSEKAFFGFDQDETGNIYIGGEFGFWIFSGRDSVFNFISNNALINLVYVIKKDSKGSIWVGSSKGLVRYNPGDKSFIGFSEENGYPISMVYGILEDDTKSLWVSTDNGLIKITNIVEDTANIKIRVYDREDGMQSKQFSYNAFYKCKSGEMAFGGINGFNTFFPDKIVVSNIQTDVILTDLKIFNKSVPIGKEVEGRLILEKSISATTEITLGPKQNIFTLEFAALPYTNSQKNIFKFKLDGLDKDWQCHKADNNYVTYTNLAAGEYTFIITAANEDGVWNENPTTLKITILPPYWKTDWFRILAVLVIVLLMVGFYYYRLNSLQKQKQLLIKQVEERTKEITTKNTILHKQADDLNEANTLLEERHQFIEEQNELLLDQAEKLNETNALLEERQQIIEEQSAELTVQKDELIEANINLKELNITKDKFFSIIAHDIKNPFQSVMGFAELLVIKFDSLDNEKRLKFAKAIYDSSMSIFKLLENLLQWSRAQTRSIKFSPTSFHLNDIIKDNSELLQENLNSKKIKLVVDNKEEIEVYADHEMINTVIRNLLSNAIKFTGIEGEIFLSYHRKNNDVVVCIRDTGIGMKQEDLQKLFKIDQNFTRNGTNDEKGTGLGLLICKEFIENHAGKIWVESEFGKGSSFYFTIPNVK